ncbi:MAG: DNA polymerase IV, partial [Candidatus Eremiobacteraeota bacterium]|nr:DNA polymerase IV [Candidatus Eremiobacteraeota bacterium]
VLGRTGLTVSAGVGTGKMIAKILSDEAKPNGLRFVAPGDEAAFLAPLSVGRLWGVGPKTQRRLAARGIERVGDIATLRDDQARALFGSWGSELLQLARGIDHRRVESERDTKSISTEETFEHDVRDESVLIGVLREQANELASKLEKEGLSARTIGIKIRRADFSTTGRQTNLSEPTMDADQIYAASVHCLRRADVRDVPVRLLGTRAATLESGGPAQTSLF